MAAPAEVPPPLQGIPTAKEKKYDRQLRLWGINGQVALESTHIVLINNGPGVTGVETLKNLVLPNVGEFTIIDSAIVSEADLGVNFFLEDASLGKFRAVEAARLLEELNPGVKGHAVTELLETLITQEKALADYNLIIVAAPIDPAILAKIQAHSQQYRIPTFYLHSVGFFSSFSVYLPPTFPIVETHPDPTSTTDLRLLKPWPALSAFAKEKLKGLEEGTMAAHDKAHIPWLCLLLHYLEKWKQAHDGNVPEAFKEKTAFRDTVRAGDYNEENFDEACAAVLKSLNPPTPPSDVRDILSAPETQNLDKSSAPFWLIANAISKFYQEHGQLPLPGAVPDMKAVSADYIILQNIYKTKARQDSAEVLATVRELEKQLGRPQNFVQDAEVENFCKGAAHIHLVRGRSIQIVEAGKAIQFGDRAKAIAKELTNDESLIGLHIAFLAWDEFVATHHTSSQVAGGQGLKVPGSGTDDFEADAEKMTGIAHKIVDNLIKEAETFVEDPEYSQIKEKIAKFCTEILRAGGGELHNIASLTGGLLAQEVIKVITRQYVPIDNTCLFDGVASRTRVLRI
ncbi:hypothetical protein LTR78_002146 [Recurvomyces mirabilis]|uniref:NEDD8-activating enzyme E1 regulatory subunit n=1 Tax=Recurvomyces mirabilis TaxID=574656 RepID=A0AAE0WUA9_9PEZI|nr:hypothetical protein LTR78_002146 [Recurvomyces mirabilis]KAK5160603.1 hypothetical protein LTS14_001615 [Recurvomyces mirabilis]